MAFSPLGMLAAFAAGLLSFLSPCVLPLVPGYLSYLAGTSVREGERPERLPAQRFRVGFHALWFVLGFVVVFTLLGAVASLLGSTFRASQQILAVGAGLLLILFGIALTGLLPIPFLSRDYRVEVRSGDASWWHSAVVGMAFGAGWSACSGPLLGSILVLTAVSATVVQGIILLFVYALGMALPFLLAGILVDRASCPGRICGLL